MTTLLHQITQFLNPTPPPDFVYPGDVVEILEGEFAGRKAIFQSVETNPFDSDDPRPMAFLVALPWETFFTDYRFEFEVASTGAKYVEVTS